MSREHMVDSAESPAGPPVTALGSPDAIPLAGALVAHLAEQAGIRAFLIKGIAAELLGLRAGRMYADVDVMVDPAGFDDLVAALAEAGWSERAHYWMFDHIDEHSMTLIHPSWPIDIDLHRYFPGFLASADEVFDALWEHRREFEMAHRPVIAHDEVSGSAFIALHALRWLHTERNKEEYSYLIEELRTRAATVQALSALAARTGSTETLGPLFAALGVTPEAGPPVDPKDLVAWNRRVSHASRTGEWFTYLLSSPVSKWPRELRTILWPPAEMYLQEHPELPRTRRAVTAARVRRVLHGFVGLGAVFRADRARRRASRAQSR
jgi:hypothetical protein